MAEVHGDWHDVIDAYVSTPLGEGGWSNIWPNSDWYKPYRCASTGVPLYFPHLNIGGAGFGGGGFYWDQRPKGEAFNVKISQQRGSHYLKAGLEYRKSYGVSYVSSTTNFNFNTGLTAETFNNPDTQHNGDQWATFLLGALDGSSQMIGGPAPDPHTKFWGMYFQDDWKLNRRITLNLGIRNEYETAWYDPAHNFSKGLDLSQPLPGDDGETAGNAVGSHVDRRQQLLEMERPVELDDQQLPGMWNAPKLALQPRAGIAIRVNDKTSIRAGYARYTIPTEFNLSGFPGFRDRQLPGTAVFRRDRLSEHGAPAAGRSAADLLASVPGVQSAVADPRQGRRNERGPRPERSLLWYDQNLKKAYNDRINISFQRQLPGQIVLNASYFMNFGHQLYNQSLNVIDPQVQLKYQNSLNQTVANPFYHYLTPTLMPGPLYNQQTVSLGSLLVPYPQYSGLAEFGHCCAGERYHSLELRTQKVFSNGFNFLFSYVYIREKSQIYFNDQDTFSNHFTWQDSDQPSHRFSMASAYELPIGVGRAHFNKIPKAADFVVGGWRVTGVMSADHRRSSALREPDRQWRSLLRRPQPAALVQHRCVLTNSGEHLRAAHQSVAVRMSDRAHVLRPRCNPVEGLQDHRKGQNRIQDGGLQRYQSLEPGRSRHQHHLFHVRPGAFPGLAGRILRTAGRHIRNRQRRPADGAWIEDNILSDSKTPAQPVRSVRRQAVRAARAGTCRRDGFPRRQVGASREAFRTSLSRTVHRCGGAGRITERRDLGAPRKSRLRPGSHELRGGVFRLRQ